MSFVELIGFVISLIALLFLFLRNKQAKGHSQIHLGENEDSDENDPLKEFLKSLEQEMENENQRRQPPPEPPKIKQTVSKSIPKEIRAKVSKREDQSREKTREVRQKEKALTYFDENIKNRDRLHPQAKGPSRLDQLIRHLPHKRHMIIYQQLLNKPKGLSLNEDLLK